MSKHYPWKSFHAATTLKLTANTTAQTLHSLTTKYAGAVNAVIQAESGPVRYAYGGYAPKAATGYRLDRFASLTLEGMDEMRNFRYIRGGATNAVLWTTYLFPDDAHARK